MIVKIAEILIHIHDSLLNEASREKLKNFIPITENTITSEFNLLPLNSPPVSVLKAEKRAENYYYEDKDQIFLMNTHSICRILKGSNTLEVAPLLKDDNLSYDVLTELRLLISEAAIRKGGFLFHSAGIILENQGFLFTGPSGAGKSTLSEIIAPFSKVISDEIVVILPESNSFFFHSTPFGTRPQNLYSPIAVEIKKIYNLKKGIITKVEKLDNKQSLRTILSGISAFPTNDEGAHHLFDNALNILKIIPCFNLQFSKFQPFDHFLKEL
jgi:hypothetical protein